MCGRALFWISFLVCLGGFCTVPFLDSFSFFVSTDEHSLHNAFRPTEVSSVSVLSGNIDDGAVIWGSRASGGVIAICSDTGKSNSSHFYFATILTQLLKFGLSSNVIVHSKHCEELIFSNSGVRSTTEVILEVKDHYSICPEVLSSLGDQPNLNLVALSLSSSKSHQVKSSLFCDAYAEKSLIHTLDRYVRSLKQGIRQRNTSNTRHLTLTVSCDKIPNLELVNSVAEVLSSISRMSKGFHRSSHPWLPVGPDQVLSFMVYQIVPFLFVASIVLSCLSVFSSSGKDYRYSTTTQFLLTVTAICGCCFLAGFPGALLGLITGFFLQRRISFFLCVLTLNIIVFSTLLTANPSLVFFSSGVIAVQAILISMSKTSRVFNSIVLCSSCFFFYHSATFFLTLHRTHREDKEVRSVLSIMFLNAVCNVVDFLTPQTQ